MSTLAEIEAALPELTAQELRQVERLLRSVQSVPRPLTELRTGNPRLAAFEALQKRLGLDEAKARAWQENVREARR